MAVPGVASRCQRLLGVSTGRHWRYFASVSMCLWCIRGWAVVSLFLLGALSCALFNPVLFDSSFPWWKVINTPSLNNQGVGNIFSIVCKWYYVILICDWLCTGVGWLILLSLASISFHLFHFISCLSCFHSLHLMSFHFLIALWVHQHISQAANFIYHPFLNHFFE